MIWSHVYLFHGQTNSQRALKHSNQLCGIKTASKWAIVDFCMLTESRVIARSIHKNWGFYKNIRIVSVALGYVDFTPTWHFSWKK